jgi:predicted ATPase
MKLSIRNFRSVKNQDLELAPLTVVYGHNGAGKSTLIYALPTLKNVILNPNQPPAAFFNYSFITLGAFDAVVFDHQLDNQIEIGVSLAESPLPAVRRVDYSSWRAGLLTRVCQPPFRMR